MTRRMFGGHKLFKAILGVIAFFVTGGISYACPACVSVGNQNFFWQTLWALFILGTVPLAIAAFVAWRIIRLQKYEQSQT